jgi:hypothetical protein
LEIPSISETREQIEFQLLLDYYGMARIKNRDQSETSKEN